MEDDEPVVHTPDGLELVVEQFDATHRTLEEAPNLLPRVALLLEPELEVSPMPDGCEQKDNQDQGGAAQSDHGGQHELHITSKTVTLQGVTGLNLEIGIAYRDGNGHLYLATDVDKLLTFRHGRAVDVVPRAKPSPVRNISVETLLKRWKIDLETLDAAMDARRELPPQTRGRKQIRNSDARLLFMLVSREIRRAKMAR